MSRWVLLTYKVPRQPTAARVGVWRKLRRLGAILVHDAVWVLPFSAFTREQAQWLASEIHDLEGSATVWLGEPFPTKADGALVEAFQTQADAAFREIVSRAKGGRSPSLLARSFQDACRLDFFRSPHREEARLALLGSTLSKNEPKPRAKRARRPSR